MQPISILEVAKDLLRVLLKIHAQVLSLISIVQDLLLLLVVKVVVVEFGSQLDFGLRIERFLQECLLSVDDLLIELGVNRLESVSHLSKGAIGLLGQGLELFSCSRWLILSHG